MMHLDTPSLDSSQHYYLLGFALDPDSITISASQFSYIIRLFTLSLFLVFYSFPLSLFLYSTLSTIYSINIDPSH